MGSESVEAPDSGAPPAYDIPVTEEDRRLAEVASGQTDWQQWGTYLAERQWGTVREDYSADGSAWDSFPYDMARGRAYRWGEDGLFGWTDNACRLCFATAFWNGRDPHLKERLFGLNNSQGNHGEDVKELYYYLDATPTGSYAKALYRYPQARFPYTALIEENRRRDFDSLEYELLDTGVFRENRAFEIVIEYAKEHADAVLIRLTISNSGPDRSALAVLPTLTFRNTWSWAKNPLETKDKPSFTAGGDGATILVDHEALGRYRLIVIAGSGGSDAFSTLFTENDTNPCVFHENAAATGYSKDAFSRYVVDKDADAINPEKTGTKAAFLFNLEVEAGATAVLRLCLSPDTDAPYAPLTLAAFDSCFDQRIAEADAFYASRCPATLSDDEQNVSRQAYAGLLWSKQAYLYNVDRWLDGDPAQPTPPAERLKGRNASWRHLSARDVISMPDKWEYPWFAAWDLAFHAIPLATLDPAFAKSQLLLMLQERYLHPNGALPAYEYGFRDANPPVHAMAVWGVYSIEKRRTGRGDKAFLERAFLKLLLNFTWWVNRNDQDGKNLFSGGFLGLDNVGLFDRNLKLPEGKTLQQADATAWMGLFCASMLDIVFELFETRPLFIELAIKFLHHYGLIIDAINSFDGCGLWDEQAGFFFDRVVVEDGEPIEMKVYSVVGLVPLFAIFIMTKDQSESLPADVLDTLRVGREENPRLAGYIGKAEVKSGPYVGAEFLAIVPKERLTRLLGHLLDEAKFLSPYGIRSVSKTHADDPFELDYDGTTLKVDYVPGEGNSGAFGGNSNWRGPIWFPMNMLILNALQRYHLVYGDDYTVECPVGSGRMLTLQDVAQDIGRRLARIFLKDNSGARPCHGSENRYADDPSWRDLILFNEYFHGETGRGLGASHQTGWTALVATCIARIHEGKHSETRVDRPTMSASTQT